MKCFNTMTTVLFMMCALPGVTACTPTDDPISPGSEISSPVPDPVPDPAPAPDPTPNPTPDPTPSAGNRLRITAGTTVFTATLFEDAAAQAFKELLPMTVQMRELNGNEKYYYLPSVLPTAASNPGTIRAGDLMLYGSDCLVLFYETFAASYAYTPLGRLDNPAGLAAVLGAGSVALTFERIR